MTANVNVCGEPPSKTTSLPSLNVAVGGTLRTVTVWVSAGPVSPSESVARTDTVEGAGPSANTHRKLDAVFEPATSVPPVPHDASIDCTVSCPGSLTENVYVCCPGPSSTVRGLPGDSVAVGGTLRTVTTCVSLPGAPSELVAVTDTVEDAGPSGNTH